ncbi:hypothetical protein ACFCZY_38430 [Streptomyces sp. NPDC056237]|uniref:hypothetical protein n=1 Tax=unclassified Streptomyces TaxID=2593676 RepID=UPI0035D99D69
MLDDGTGRIHQHLQPLADALQAAAEPRSILEWLAGEHVHGLVGGLATGRIALSHEALDPLEPVATVDHLRDLLVRHGVLPPVDKQLTLFQRWLPRYLATVTEPAHQRLLGHFATWHVLHRLRRQAAKRHLAGSAHHQAKQEITQAAALLAWLHVHGRTLDQLGQADIDAYFSEHTATRRSCLPFLRWCATAGRTRSLALPTIKVSNPAPITQHRRLELIRDLLAGDRTAAHFTVAGLLVLLYAQPVTRIVTLTTDDVIRQGDETLIRIGEPPLPVPEPFAEFLREYLDRRPNQNTAANPASTWLFPGRRAGRPMDPTTIRDALRKAGVPALGSRIAALRQLVLQAPAPVVAGMLGYHDTTATRTATEAGSPWSRYAPGDHSR